MLREQQKDDSFLDAAFWMIYVEKINYLTKHVTEKHFFLRRVRERVIISEMKYKRICLINFMMFKQFEASLYLYEAIVSSNNIYPEKSFKVK
ncbi:hypothetical protein T4B_7936 [Trichinella pseudospiralis]|uniref:Uncharacterized protein n=1 Tax=Trichinella pseudospiralis TaxID=6337 RepID=A0A0V1F1A1_TRIPS|nr:hypothetical protein T4A_1240 [Trichinella pseudospiralis]KRZ33911.1 hypothetical protein T4B_7936 [Trichinella pseudospiralis]KRZ42688.1 hypothetical protein T4C_10202 [Trichinella pseudospiralis]